MSQEFKVRVLDELTIYAEDLGDIFMPDDVQLGEVLVRKAHIKVLSKNAYCPVALAYWRKEDGSMGEFAAWVDHNGDGSFELSIGYALPGTQIRAGLAAVGVVA